MGETIEVPKELLDQIMKKMECVESRIKRLDKLSKI